MQSKKLTTLQLELLNIFSLQPSEEDMLAIKKMLASYFSDKLERNIQKAIDEKQINEENLSSWIDE